MKKYLVTIETYYSTEEFLIPMNTEKSEVLQIDKALADVCFCDDYAIVKWEEVSSEYMAEREKLVKLWEEENNESIEFRAISGKYATLKSLKVELKEVEFEKAISNILTEKYGMEKEEIKEVVDELVYRLNIPVDEVEKTIDEYMDR